MGFIFSVQVVEEGWLLVLVLILSIFLSPIIEVVVVLVRAGEANFSKIPFRAYFSKNRQYKFHNVGVVLYVLYDIIRKLKKNMDAKASKFTSSIWLQNHGYVYVTTKFYPSTTLYTL